MLTMVMVASIIAIRILRDATSSDRKSRYNKPVKYILILSLVFGVIFSFYETFGLVAAEITSVCILVSSLYYSLLGGWITSHQSLRSFWLPSENIKEWFFYLSLYSAVIGVVSGVLSVIFPYFSPIVIPATISTVYSGISVLAALIDFTIRLPDFSTICGLVYAFCFVTRRFTLDREFYVEDIDFEKIVANTHHTEFDVRESLESLVKQGFAIKQSPTPMGRVRFKINMYGAKYLEVCWTETLIRISRQKEKVEKIISYVEHRATDVMPSDKKIIAKAIEEIELQKKVLIKLENEYGMALGESWGHNIVRRIDYLEMKLKNSEERNKNSVSQIEDKTIND